MVSRKREDFGLNVSRKREMVVSRKREDNFPESQRSVDNPQNGPQKRSKPLRGLAGRERCPGRAFVAPGRSLGLIRPLARDGLSPGDASGGTGGISGTTDRRCPPVRESQRARTASRLPPWVRPGLGPRCGFSALPSNSVVSPPQKHRRSWGFLKAIGPAVVKGPPVESRGSRAGGPRHPWPSSSSTPARPA